VRGRAAGGLKHQRELLADDALPDELVEPFGSQRALDGALVVVRAWSTRAEARPRGVGPGRSRGPPEMTQRRPQRAGDVGPGLAVLADGLTASPACLADQPSPTRASTTWSRPAAPGPRRPGHGRRGDRGCAEPVGELEHDRCAPLRRCPAPS
jgi:hypothetical protein